MKIGILTYHRAENYGALLQAFALKTFLDQYFHEVGFVDYWPQYHIDHYKLFLWTKFIKLSFKGKLVYLFKFFLWYPIKRIRQKRLQRFMHRYLGVGSKPKYSTSQDICKEFDIVIYGSDQIWRKQKISGYDGYNEWYFGSANISASHKISYAASMGIIDADVKEIQWIKGMLSNFDDLSIREDDLHSFLSGIGLSAKLVIDPVFLLSKQQWSEIIPKKTSNEKYILFYNLLGTPESEIIVEKYHKKTKLPIKEINMVCDFDHIGNRYKKCVSLETFLFLLSNADVVFSNSFHGVAMSLVFNKQFYAVGMREKASRVKSLLHIAGIDQRYVENELKVLPSENIDFNFVSSKLNLAINDSKQFLLTALQNVSK